MKLKHILFPTDFSRYNDAALSFASRLASESGAVLHILHVDDSLALNAAMGEAVFLYETPEELRAMAEERLAKVQPTLANVACKHHYRAGSPVAEILRFAEEEEADLIAMASHGRTGLSRVLMGSIAEGVMRKAKCPVLIVKPEMTAVEDVSEVAIQGARG